MVSPSYCHPENKVSLGLVEGVNNKIRVLQRRAYGYRDEEYLKLKIVAAFLPAITQKCSFQPTRIRVDPEYSDLDLSQDTLVAARWPNGVTCPRCVQYL